MKVKSEIVKLIFSEQDEVIGLVRNEMEKRRKSPAIYKLKHASLDEVEEFINSEPEMILKNGN